MTVRYYSSVASEKTLTGTITAGQTTLVVSNTIGLPGSFPYTLAVDYETVSEELVNVTNAAGTTLTIDRAIDGTSASSHNAGARVRHVTSARDFSDSRNHENADDGIHGLSPGEEIVGTDKVQTLTNKTFVNAQGTFLNPDFNLTGTAVSTWNRSPAGADTVVAQELTNGTEQTWAQFNNGHTKIRNPLALDTAVTTRRVSVTMSDGTTERFRIEASGQVVSLPRSGTTAGNSGFKVVDPGDLPNRRLFKVMDSTDAVEKFTISSGGTTSIHTTDPAAISLFIQQAATPSSSSILVFDDASNTLFNVDLAGMTNMRRRALVTNDDIPANTVLQVRGNATQSGNLTQWQNSASTALARVRSDGSSDFTPVVTTTGVTTAATGWSTVTEIAVVKAGIATIQVTFLRTGGNIVPDAAGDVVTDPAVFTMAAAFRPNSAFGAATMTFSSTNDSGTGSVNLNPSTGGANLMTWSTGGTLFTGQQLRVTMTYALAFS